MRNIVIYILLFIVLIAMIVGINNCSNKQKDGIKTITTTVTHWVTRTITLKHSSPTLVTTVYKERPALAAPSRNYDSLLLQYNMITRQYYALNNAIDTLTIDSSYIVINDTISHNLITGRKTLFAMKYPHKIITVEKTITPAPKCQLYIGGGLASVNELDGLIINVGFLYRNKRENIAGFNIGVDNTGNIIYGINAYWKLKLRK